MYHQRCQIITTCALLHNLVSNLVSKKILRAWLFVRMREEERGVRLSPAIVCRRMRSCFVTSAPRWRRHVRKKGRNSSLQICGEWGQDHDEVLRGEGGDFEDYFFFLLPAFLSSQAQSPGWKKGRTSFTVHFLFPSSSSLPLSSATQSSPKMISFNVSPINKLVSSSCTLNLC